MGNRYLLAIDVGTTTAKAALFDIKGQLITTATQEYPTYYPKPGWVEQDPEDWWNAAVKVVREAIGKAKIDPRDIGGICASSQRETMAFIDKDGKSLGRIPIWMDRRSTPQAEWIMKNFDIKEIYKKTGLIVDATFTATKLMWLKEHNPELLKKAWKGLQPKDYLVYKMTGKAVTDYSAASRTMLFDINKLQWDHELIEDLGLSGFSHILPDAYPSSEVIGEVTTDAADILGIVAGIPVVAGMGDRQAEVLGAGILEPTRLEESTGTGSTTATHVDEPKLDPKMRYVVTASAVKGKWTIEAGMSTAGAVLRWFRDQFAEGESILANMTRRRAYEYLDMEAEYVPPGSNGLIVLPFFSGARAPRWNPKARGLIFGLTVYHSRAHVFRALMEGIAYEIRKILEVLQEQEISSNEIVVMGGGGKTPTWARIKANVTGKEVILPELLDAALAGDAIVAGVGTKLIESFSEGTKLFFKERARIKPDPQITKVYDKYYKIYDQLVSAMENYYEMLAEAPEAEPVTPAWDIEKLIHLLFKLEA